jgi:hypothetical protein
MKIYSSRARSIVSHLGYFDVKEELSYATAERMKCNIYCKQLLHLWKCSSQCYAFVSFEGNTTVSEKYISLSSA